MLRLFLFWSLLAALVSTWLGLALGWIAAAASAVIVLGFGFLGFFLSERWLASIFGATPTTDDLLVRTYQAHCLDLSATPLPRLMVFSSPLILVFVGRAWGSRGSILISSGALSLLGPEALEAVLRASVVSVRESGSPSRTWATLLRHVLTFEGAPSPLGFLLRLSLMPWTRTLIRTSWSGKKPISEAAKRVMSSEQALERFLEGPDLSRFEGVRLS